MDEGWKAGLEDVIAARSAICRIDGSEGRLYYRGYEIGEVAGRLSFEDTTFLLWFGERPTPAESEAFGRRLRATRQVPLEIIATLRALPRDCHPLDALRTGLSLAAAFDPATRDSSRDANIDKACRLMSLVPGIVAAWQRIRSGHEPVAPSSSLSHAAHFLYSLTGDVPKEDVARVMDLILTLHADHEFNASTFTARVIVATLADLHAAIVAAVAALKGPRHGGANEDVLMMLKEIGDPGRAEAFIESRLGARATLTRAERGDPRARVPGFGHRVYKVDDARARVLRGMAKSMAEATGRTRLFEVAERVYDIMRRETGLPVNVDFFSAVVYDALGIACTTSALPSASMSDIGPGFSVSPSAMESRRPLPSWATVMFGKSPACGP
jgi:citrate synthase